MDRVTIRHSALLALLGATSFVLYRVGLGADGTYGIRLFLKVALAQSVIYLLAAWLISRARSSRSTLLIVVAFAILFRLSIVFASPYLSDDIYRYIWDGRVQAAGINPYRYIPSAPELAHLRDDTIYPKINRRDSARTIYPPLAQALFFLTTRVSESVTWMKLTMLGFEAVAIWAIAQMLASFGLPRQRLLIYSWHPLVIWEFAGSGHADAISIAFIALAFLAWRRNANPGAGLALAGATLVKLFPLVLLPAFLKRQRWTVPLVFVAAIVVGYLSYLSVGPKAVLGSLPFYAQEVGLISGEQFYALSLARKLFEVNLSPLSYMIVAVLVMGAIAVWVMQRETGSEDNLKPGLVLATATTVLFAPHFSWYFAWLVPFLCFVPRVSVFYLTIASIYLYRTWLGDSREEMFVINSLIYLPFIFIGVLEWLWRRQVSRKGAKKQREITNSELLGNFAPLRETSSRE